MTDELRHRRARERYEDETKANATEHEWPEQVTGAAVERDRDICHIENMNSPDPATIV